MAYDRTIDVVNPLHLLERRTVFYVFLRDGRYVWQVRQRDVVDLGTNPERRRLRLVHVAVKSSPLVGLRLKVTRKRRVNLDFVLFVFVLRLSEGIASCCSGVRHREARWRGLVYQIWCIVPSRGGFMSVIALAKQLAHILISELALH